MRTLFITLIPINGISALTRLFFARKTQKIISNLLITALCLISWALPAAAELTAVSGKPDPAVNEVAAAGNPADVAFSLAHGFPLWFRDANGLKLELCLDQEAATAAGPFFPCLTEEPFLGGPISFPVNFGPEAFWWSATAFSTFTSSLNGAPLPGDALLVLAQEASFSSLAVLDGAQMAFGRIRIRINVPVAGTYEVTHPYGTATYVVPLTGLNREINQTQDIGNFLVAGAPPAGNFLLALANGPAPAPPAGFDPAVSAGIVANVATGLGPFLVPAGLLPVTALNGNRYLSDPGTLLAPLTVPVTGGPNGNVFRIRLLNPPAGFLLNAAGNSQEIVLDRFQVHGKIFNDGPNVAPAANPDNVAAAKDRPATIDVLANDTDVVSAGNVHGINPQAIGLPSVNPADLPGTILLARPQTTANGGTVRRFTNIVTGKATFTYTPPPGFVGVDTFSYVAQDTGGRVSAPATVSVLVEDLTATASRWSRTGRWQIKGTSSDITGNSIKLLGGPRAVLSGAGETPPVTSAAAGRADLRIMEQAIDYRLILESLPASAVTLVNIRTGAAGVNGPAIFTLFDSRSGLPFPTLLSGQLTEVNFQAQPAVNINNFSDALGAILAGNAYIEVRTLANPVGEIRGQFILPLIGEVPVGPSGTWNFSGKSKISPGAYLPSVNAVSTNGVRLLGLPLKLR